MALGDPYITEAELKAHLGIQESTITPARALLLTGIVSAASRAVEEYCDRQFNKDDDPSPRRYVLGSSKTLQVDDFHSSDIVVKVGMLSGAFGAAIPDYDYLVSPLNGLSGGVPVAFHSVKFLKWVCPGDDVEVTAEWGWPSVPEPVTHATLLMAAQLWASKDAPLGVAGFNQGLGQVRVRESLLASSLLCPYKRNRLKVA